VRGWLVSGTARTPTGECGVAASSNQRGKATDVNRRGHVRSNYSSSVNAAMCVSDPGLQRFHLARKLLGAPRGLVLDLRPVSPRARCCREVLATALANIRVVIQVKIVVNDAQN